MEYRESASGLIHKTCLGNIMLCSKVVISFQTRTIPTHEQRLTVQNLKAKLTDNLSAATSSLWTYPLYSNAVYDHFS